MIAPLLMSRGQDCRLLMRGKKGKKVRDMESLVEKPKDEAGEACSSEECVP